MTYRHFGSRLEGHPTPVLPWVDVATGSLGQGLPIGVGMALAGKRLDRLPFRVWVICGDSEMAEGSMWEAIEHAAFYELDNLTAIVDVNRLGQRGQTMHGWDLSSYSRRLEANGWHAIEIDGHDVEQIDRAYTEAERTTGRPTAIVARTLKGKGYSKVEDQDGWHGKAVAEEGVQELGGIRNVRVELSRPEGGEPHTFQPEGGEWPSYDVGSEVATRKGYGDALAALGGDRGDVVALDGEVSNSTYAEIFRDAHPERYFEMYIAEQQMVAAAVGMQVLGWKPFCSTFAAFTTRAYDFVRMAAVSRATIKLCGSHAGVSIGEDGPSQMGLEDLAAFRAIHGSTVLYPCDGNQAARLVREMADVDGISYLRTTRSNTPVIYGPDEEFPIGGSKTLRDGDDVTIVAAGITVHEALKAADALAVDGISARVLDCYSVKPIDAETLRAAGDRIVTVEDHWAEGGLGEAVLATLADVEERPRVIVLAVRQMPRSGKPAEQLADAGIDADAIAGAARRLVGEYAPA
jgi:transketolase